MKNTIWLSLFLLMKSTMVFSQAPTPQDCMGAIPICHNIYTLSHVAMGSGNFDAEINPNISCLKNDSFSTWYSFTVQTSGLLRFSILPFNSSDDFDWAVFDLSNANCSAIFSDSSLAISCNSYQNTIGKDGETGARSANGGTDSWNGPGVANGPAWNADIPVIQGSTYVLVVANTTHSGYGYSIDFNGSTAQIYDNRGAFLRSVASSECGDSVIKILFSENVLKNSVQSSDFEISGPNGTISIDSIYAMGDAIGGRFERQYLIRTNQPLQKGSYQLLLTGSVDDMCGNASQADAYTFEVDGLSFQTSSTPVTCNDNGTASCLVVNGRAPYTYSWDNGDVNSTIRGLSARSYRVTVLDSRGCKDSTLVIVPIGNESLRVRLEKTDVACYGERSGRVMALASFGTAPYFYRWSNGEEKSEIKSVGVGKYYLTVTDYHGCVVQDSIEVGQSSELLLRLDSVIPETCSYADGAIFVSADGGSPPYRYIWAHPGASNSSKLLGLHAGSYYLTLIDAMQCETILKVELPGDPSPVADFLIFPPNAFLSQANVFFENRSNDIVSWYWSFGDSTYSSEKSPMHTYGNVGNYNVMLVVQSSNMCIDTLVKNISIVEDFYFYMPNAFTPNGDYRNECLKPSIFGKRATNYSFEVYSRWGDLIFKTHDIEKCWDGDISIELPTSETKYLYHIKVYDLCNNLHEFLGSFVMMR